MFHLRKCINLSIKLCNQRVKIINHSHFFSNSATTITKAFIGNEVKFAHAVLENNPQCKVLRGEQNEDNVVESANIDFNQNWSDLTTGGIVESLKTVVKYCEQNEIQISDERFDKFVDACTERCFDFTDDQIIQSLRTLSRHPTLSSPKTRNFVELWTALDDACVERIPSWDSDQIFYLCDHWHMLHLGRRNKFNAQGLFKINRKLRKLPPHEMVQLMFYLSIKRLELVDMFDVETKLLALIDEMSINEIAVAGMAYFKTQTKIKTVDLVKKIYRRAIREIDTIEDIPLSCILKTLRHSCTIHHLPLVREMLDAAHGQLSRLSTLTCLQVALLGTHLHICHQDCIEQILQRFCDDVKSIRIKDFERITYVIGFFDFKSESNIETRLLEQILPELRNRVNEIVQFPQCLTLCLHYLSLKGYHDEEMISAVLSPQFLKFAYGRPLCDNGLFGLDAYAKISLKGTYSGNALSEKNRQHMGRMLTEYIPDRNAEFKIGVTNNLLLEVKETIDELCIHAYLAHALPHFSKPDVIIAYDKKSNTGIDISLLLPRPYFGKLIERSMLVQGLPNCDPSSVEIINIIVGGWGNYIRDTQKMNGFARQKIEQSRMLGLRPVVVPWFDWTRLHREERPLYMKCKINEALQ